MVGDSNKSGMKRFAIKAAISFMVIVVGIVVGVTVAVNTGLTERLKFGKTGLRDFPNETALNVGGPFPLITLYDNSEQAVRLDEVLSNKTTLVTFVSYGCDPCHWLVQRLDELKQENELSVNTIIVSLDPTYFREHSTLPAYRIDTDGMGQLQIVTMPSIAVVGPSGEISAVYSGYTQDHLDATLERIRDE